MGNGEGSLVRILRSKAGAYLLVTGCYTGGQLHGAVGIQSENYVSFTSFVNDL